MTGESGASNREELLDRVSRISDSCSLIMMQFHEQVEVTPSFLEDENIKIFARKVVEHYSARTNQTLVEREASPIIHLKKLNNWIKSVLIQLYARRGNAVLDLTCGKGGDLIKWDKAKTGYYVGIDIAEGSIEDCRTRYNGDADHRLVSRFL